MLKFKAISPDFQVRFTMDENTTLSDLLSLNLHEYEEEVRNIVDKAVKEMSMEKVLKELDVTWSTMEFEHDKHPRTGITLLKTTEELIETLEDNQVRPTTAGREISMIKDPLAQISQIDFITCYFLYKIIPTLVLVVQTKFSHVLDNVTNESLKSEQCWLASNWEYSYENQIKMDDLFEDWGISCVLALEAPLCCTKPSNWLSTIHEWFLIISFAKRNDRNYPQVFICLSIWPFSYQVQLQNMLTSKFIAHFLEEVSSWQKKLSTADQVITIWMEVQRTWSHLESIFIGSEDIRSQLPEDSKRFDNIDSSFKVNNCYQLS